MATATWDKSLTAQEGESATVAITTAASSLAVKPGFDGVQLYSGSAWRMALAPALLSVLYYSASAGTYTSYRTEATDTLTTTHVPLDAMAIADWVYLGFSAPALGVWINKGSNVNAESTVTLDVEYCSTANAIDASVAFTDVLGDGDTTSSGNATLAIDGFVTWTLPTAWVRSTLGTYSAPAANKCFWIRLSPAEKVLSTTVDLLQIVPLYKNTNYGWQEASTTYVLQFDSSRCGGLTLKGSTSQNLNVTWLRH